MDPAGAVVVEESIGPDGESFFWLVAVDGDRGGHWRDAMAPHEARLGQLPRQYLEKLGRVCGYPSRHTGRRCRRVVAEFGLLCAEHYRQLGEETGEYDGLDGDQR